MPPLLALFGPTASGKSALALALAQRFAGEIVSCDSVAVYRQMELGTAKPSPADRALIPHHCLDLFDPDETCTAGDYARKAREAIASIASRGALPIVAGGTGLYLRALLDGLFPAPQANPSLRELLRRRASTRGPQHLHRTLRRLDPAAAEAIHPNDLPKVIRAIEVSVAGRRPISSQWSEKAREALTGYTILRLALAPPRPELYARINLRGQAMFRDGLLEETRTLIARFGPACRPFSSLGYAEAAAVLRDEISPGEAIAHAQQGHRNFSKRQTTWFRREAELHPVHWLRGFGDDPNIVNQAADLLTGHLGPGQVPDSSSPSLASSRQGKAPGGAAGRTP